MSASSSSLKKYSPHDLVLMALFTALMAVCAWITVPVPNIPFTLQLLAVFASLFYLGGKKGTLSILVYLLLGALGAPVFSGFGGGLGKLLGVTGGYLLGFLFTGLIYWLITSCFPGKNSSTGKSGEKSTVKPGTFVSIGAALAGLVLCYAFGTGWFMYIYMKNTGPIGLSSVLMMCVVPYVIPDLIKLALAWSITTVIRKALRHKQGS